MMFWWHQCEVRNVLKAAKAPVLEGVLFRQNKIAATPTEATTATIEIMSA
jgi:hypothetical protein